MDEIKCIEDYLNDKYKIFIRATNNPGLCLDVDSLLELVGWFAGDSMDLDNNIWENKSGSNRRFTDGDDGIVEGEDIDVDLGTNELNEYYINGNPIVTGTKSTSIAFGPVVTTEYTVFNLCKYNDASYGRLLQGSNVKIYFLYTPSTIKICYMLYIYMTE